MSNNNGIEKIIDRYFSNQFSKQDLIEMLQYLSEEDISLFEDKLQEVWDESDVSEIPLTQKEKLRIEADNIIRKSKRQSKSIFRHKFLRIKQIAAAIVLIAFTSSLFYYYFNNASEIQFENIVVASGEKMKYILPDRTDVYVNSATTLKYPKGFEGDERIVELNGEAFFDVTPDKSKPFIINANQISVKVLGTSFNVKNYDNDEWILVTVETGLVSVTISEENSSIQLSPYEELWINKEDYSFSKIKKDAHYASLWRKGHLYFDKTPINDVINALNRNYNVNIELESPEKKYIISGEHDNKNLQSVLNSICFITNLKQRTEDHRIILY